MPLVREELHQGEHLLPLLREELYQGEHLSPLVREELDQGEQKTLIQLPLFSPVERLSLSLASQRGK